MSAGVLAYVRDYVSHMFENVFSTATTNAAVATTVKSNAPAYETPYVWSREFLEESGFNLTERIPALLGVYKIPGVQYVDNFPARRLASAVPPELSLHWMLSVLGNIFGAMINTVCGLDMGDLAWVIVLGLVIAVLYHWRSYLLPMLFRVWEEQKEAVGAFMRRQFPPPPSACNELPPGTTTISSEDVNALHTSVDAIQRRINNLHMSKYNYVRSRTGIVYNVDNFSKLQAQLTKAQEALKKEKATKARVTFNFVRSRRGSVVPKQSPSEKLQKQLAKARKALANERASHEETRDFLEHQTNARADAEEELEQLRAKLEAEEGELDDNAQLETIEGTEEESPAADDTNSQLISNEPTVEAMAPQGDAVDGNPQPSTHLDSTEEVEAEPSLEQTNAQVERLQYQLNIEQANYRVAFTKKELFRQGGRKLKQELEDLQAEYNVLEDSRDIWKQTCEALEEQADVQAVRTLRDQMQSDNAHNERRIGALETQLGFERNNREEAQSIARDLRESYRKLQRDLEEANAKYESLQTAYGDLDNMHDAEERANEDKEEEITVLKAKYDLLHSQLIKMDERHEDMDAESTGAPEIPAAERQGESWQNYDVTFQQPRGSRTTNAEEVAPLRRVQSAPLWLPLPHHGDTFDPLYDVSDYGDDDSGRKDEKDEEDEDRGPDSGEHDDDHDSWSDNGDGPGEDDKDDDDDDDPDDGRNGGADKVALDADVAPEDHIANSPGRSEDRASSELPLDNGQLPENLPSPEPSSQGSTFSMNGSAPNFVPAVRPKEPTPPLLPHHQAYIASQHGSASSDSGSDSAIAPAAESSLQNQYPFPQIGIPEYTPAPKAAGPGQAKNPHVQKLNQEVKRLDWRRKSGMPDRAQDEEGVAAPENVLDDMYDRQIAQSLNPSLTHPSNDSQPSSPSPSPAPKLDSPQQDITAPLPAPQPQFPTRESSPPAASATNASSPSVQGQAHDGANAAHHEQPARPRRPSNFFPGIENLTKTHNEEVSDALADYLSQRPTKSLSESIWAKKPDTSSKPPPQHSSPAPARATDASSPAAQGEIPSEENAEAVHQAQPARFRRPSNFFPGIENLAKTHNEEVSDALADYLSQRPTKSLSDSIWAKNPDASSKATLRQSSPAPTQAPQTPIQPATGAIPRAPPAPPPNPNPNPPPGPTADSSTIWSPRGNERGRGGAHGRAPPPHTPTQPVRARAPLGTPRIPPAGPGAGRSGWSRRGNGGGRGARGWAAAPAPKAGNAAGESFRRLQERMARAAAEEKEEKGEKD